MSKLTATNEGLTTALTMYRREDDPERFGLEDAPVGTRFVEVTETWERGPSGEGGLVRNFLKERVPTGRVFELDGRDPEDGRQRPTFEYVVVYSAIDLLPRLLRRIQ